MVQFSKMDLVDGKLVTVETRSINPGVCPHTILVADHYREDGSCKCNDEHETVMKEWGYRWSKKQKRWL